MAAQSTELNNGLWFPPGIKGKPVQTRYSHLCCEADNEAHIIGLRAEKMLRRMKLSQKTCHMAAVFLG